MAKQPIFTHEELIAMWHVMPEENASVAQKSALEKLDQYAREYREAETMSKYAIVNADCVITEIGEREALEARTGHMRELVELVNAHKVGDEINWGSNGVELDECSEDTGLPLPR